MQAERHSRIPLCPRPCADVLPPHRAHELHRYGSAPSCTHSHAHTHAHAYTLAGCQSVTMQSHTHSHAPTHAIHSPTPIHPNAITGTCTLELLSHPRFPRRSCLSSCDTQSATYNLRWYEHTRARVPPSPTPTAAPSPGSSAVPPRQFLQPPPREQAQHAATPQSAGMSWPNGMELWCGGRWTVVVSAKALLKYKRELTQSSLAITLRHHTRHAHSTEHTRTQHSHAHAHDAVQELRKLLHQALEIVGEVRDYDPAMS